MSSLKRMLAILDVFSPEDPKLTAEDIMARLQYSSGTAYRYIRELATAGLIVRITGGYYSLGPRIVELDYIIRQNLPHLEIVTPVMRGLSEQLECDTLWISYFGNRMFATHHERGAEMLPVNYGRGRRLPLFRGAGPRMIVSVLPAARQRRLYQDNVEQVAAAGLGKSWKVFRANMSETRRAGFAISRGELNTNTVGIAAPIRFESADNPGALVLLFNRKLFAILDEKKVIGFARSAAVQINEAIAKSAEPGSSTRGHAQRRS
jgi:DNA-binding IclR family transcriptional regulator